MLVAHDNVQHYAHQRRSLIEAADLLGDIHDRLSVHYGYSCLLQTMCFLHEKNYELFYEETCLA